MALYVPFLVAGMLFTGSSNSLWTKFQDMQCVENCSDPDPAKRVYYEQPVWQTIHMFVGELGCFLPVLFAALRHRQRQPNDTSKSERAPLRGRKILLFWLPALCDLTATTLMNVGLLYTPVSIYQMTRGALVLFVGILSVVFLKRRLHPHQWFALLVVVIGVAVVGLSGSLTKQVLDKPSDLTESPSDEAPSEVAVIVGVLFVLFAQIGTAIQFVLEEQILEAYSVTPLNAVGLEGFFGLFTILLVSPILANLKSRSEFFDLPRGWHQMTSNPPVWGSAIAIATSIGFYNFFGMSVTRHVSATMRSIIDTCRTITIWMISLALGWETLVWPYSLLQVLGFSFVVYGTFLFNSLISPPACLRPPPVVEYEPIASDENQGLLSEEHETVIEDREVVAGRSLDQTAVLPADVGLGFDVIPSADTKRRD